MAKRMTIEGVLAAKARAVAMFDNFGREDEAAEFESMTAEEYAERKDIEIVSSNPSTSRKDLPMAETRRRNPAERADALAEENKDLRSKLDQLKGIASVAGSIDSEDGLRRSLGRMATVLEVDEDEEDYDDEESDDEDDEESDDEDEEE